MSEEMTEEIVEEEVAIDLDEIAKKYEEKGFFKRLNEMFKGLSKPHDTREYKIARIELQRLAAPLTAIVVPIVFGVVLCVVTMISSQKKDIIVFSRSAGFIDQMRNIRKTILERFLLAG